MNTGIVAMWRDSWGFITPTNGGLDIFAHSTALPPGRTTLVHGEVVSFDVANNQRGVHAVNIHVSTGKDAEVERAYATRQPVRMGEDR